MSTTTLSHSNLFRIGGIAAILSVLFSFGAFVVPVALAIGSLALVVFLFALYRLFSVASPLVSLVVAAVSIVGAIALAVGSIPAGLPNNSLSSLATWAAWFLPPLAFGWLAYRHSEAGMPRLLAIIGLVGGVFGLINLIATLLGGGNWANPNNPALAPIIMGSYYLSMLPTLVWLVWTGIVLLRRRA